MGSTYTDNGGIEKIGLGEQAGAWGTTTNNNFDIVLRPHTREPLEAWKTFLEGVPNVHVIKEEAITPWINNALQRS